MGCPRECPIKCLESSIIIALFEIIYRMHVHRVLSKASR